MTVAVSVIHASVDWTAADFTAAYATLAEPAHTTLAVVALTDACEKAKTLLDIAASSAAGMTAIDSAKKTIRDSVASLATSLAVDDVLASDPLAEIDRIVDGVALLRPTPPDHSLVYRVAGCISEAVYSLVLGYFGQMMSSIASDLTILETLVEPFTPYVQAKEQTDIPPSHHTGHKRECPCRRLRRRVCPLPLHCSSPRRG